MAQENVVTKLSCELHHLFSYRNEGVLKASKECRHGNIIHCWEDSLSWNLVQFRMVLRCWHIVLPYSHNHADIRTWAEERHTDTQRHTRTHKLTLDQSNTHRHTQEHTNSHQWGILSLYIRSCLATVHPIPWQPIFVYKMYNSSKKGAQGHQGVTHYRDEETQHQKQRKQKIWDDGSQISISSLPLWKFSKEMVRVSGYYMYMGAEWWMGWIDSNRGEGVTQSTNLILLPDGKVFR